MEHINLLHFLISSRLVSILFMLRWIEWKMKQVKNVHRFYQENIIKVYKKIQLILLTVKFLQRTLAQCEKQNLRFYCCNGKFTFKKQFRFHVPRNHKRACYCQQANGSSIGMQCMSIFCQTCKKLHIQLDLLFIYRLFFLIQTFKTTVGLW